jgi:hypothetical protein
MTMMKRDAAHPQMSQILLALLAGAIINVAIAWAIARWALPSTGSPFIGLENQSHMANDTLRWPYAPPVNWPDRPMQRSGERWPFAHREHFRAEADTPEQIEARRVNARANSYEHLLHYANAMTAAAANIHFASEFVRIGWPCLSLSGERFEHQAAQVVPAGSTWPLSDSTVQWAIELPAPAGPQGWMLRGDLLPLRPLWPGFAINTVFYAAIVWLLCAVPLALRRRNRIRKGLCAKCGYDLRGIASEPACPECGAVRTPTAL